MNTIMNIKVETKKPMNEIQRAYIIIIRKVRMGPFNSRQEIWKVVFVSLFLFMEIVSFIPRIRTGIHKIIMPPAHIKGK